jgi:hypothetical protein
MVAGVFIVCLIRLCGFVRDNAVNLLFEDQWVLLAPLMRGQGPWSCFFLQEGPQRQGLGGLVYWCLYWATGWNVRAEVWAEVIVLALATMIAITMAARLRGRLAWSDAAFPLLLLSPRHWQTMTLTTMLAYGILPLFLILLLAWAWAVKNIVARVALVGALGGISLFTSYGLCGTVAAIGLTLVLWLRPDQDQAKSERRQAALVLLLLGVAAAIFAHGYRWEPGIHSWRFPMPAWWDYPRFCALMFTSLLGLRTISTTTTVAGAMLLGLIMGAWLWAAALIWRGEKSPWAKAVWIMTGASLFYVVLVAIGRLPLSIETAFAWRYTALLTLGVCGLIIAAEQWALSRPKTMQRCVAVAGLAIAGLIWCNFLPEQEGSAVAKAKRLWIACYLKTHDLQITNRETGYSVFSTDPDSPLVAEELHWLEQRHLSFFRDLDNDGHPGESPPVSGR